MFETITSYLTPMDVRSIRTYIQFKEEQMRYTGRHYRRFYAALGHESRGVRLLRYILQFLDYDYLDSRSNNYERYTEYFRYIRRDLMNMFDRVRQGRGFHHLFIEKSPFVCEEYLLPIEDVNTITNLPLDTNDWTVWRRVRPLRFWTHDSDELSMRLLHGQFGYTYFPPSYVVELLDVIALSFKFYIWLKFYRDKEIAQELAYEAPQQLFIQKYVLCDLLWDQLDIWLLRNFYRLNEMYSVDEVRKSFSAQALQMDSQYGRVHLSAERGYIGLYREYYENPNIDFRALLSAPILRHASFIDRIMLCQNALMLPRLSDYTYLRILRDFDALHFLTKALFRTKASPGTRISLVRELRVQSQRLQRHRPWQKCNNLVIQKTIQEKLEAFDTLLKN